MVTSEADMTYRCPSKQWFFVASTASSLVAHIIQSSMRRHILYNRTRSLMLLITFCCHCSLITKQHSTKTAMTKAKMWYGKTPCVPYQLQKWYDICRVCRRGAGDTALSSRALSSHFSSVVAKHIKCL